MSIHTISRELVAYQRYLERIAKNNNQTGIQLAGEELASLIEDLRATNEELLSINRRLET